MVGAGISGLALGYELLQRGVEPLVLEREARAGGKLESRREGGFLLESGAAGFLDRAPAIARLIGEIGLEPRLVDARPEASRRAVAVDGALHEVPRGPGALVVSSLLSTGGKLRLLGDLLLPRGGDEEDEPVAAFARRRLGREAAERIFFPLVSGLYAGDPERISLASAFPFIAGLERRHRSLILGAARERSRARGLGRLRTFKDGMEELPRALAARLGARLRVGAAVRRLSPRAGGGWTIAFEDRGDQVEVSAPSVALALPAHAAAPLVAPFSPRSAEAASQIGYVPVALVYLGYRAGQLARPPALYGFLTARHEATQLLGAVISSTVFPGRAPDGEVLISARLGGARHPAALALDDARLAALAHRELAALLSIRGAPIASHLVRHSRALPQYTLGHAARVAQLDAAEREWPGLYFTGSAYRGIGVPDCLAEAARCAEEIALREEPAPMPAISTAAPGHAAFTPTGSPTVNRARSRRA
ncbi:MAG TPA: protoporphyrinogen oxidase [Polyangia bacterium]